MSLCVEAGVCGRDSAWAGLQSIFQLAYQESLAEVWT